MHPTRIDLSKEVRQGAIDMLQPALAEVIDLSLGFKQAHWNVKGANFAQLHEFFDEGAAEMYEHADLLAERIVQLGGQADGSLRTVAKTSSLGAFPANQTSSSRLVKAFAVSLAAFGKRARKCIDRATKLGDASTADIFTEISRAVDKRLWLVESHLHR